MHMGHMMIMFLSLIIEAIPEQLKSHDDYYPPNRISHAVDKLTKNSKHYVLVQVSCIYIFIYNSLEPAHNAFEFFVSLSTA